MVVRTTFRGGHRAILLCVLIFTFALPVFLAGCRGPQEKAQSTPADGMLKPQDPSSGNKGRDLYDELQREEQEEE